LKLSDIKNNETVVITKILGHGSFRKRIAEMGFIKGKQVKVIKTAPFNGPVEYKILNYNISLRRSEADRIEVIPLDEFVTPPQEGFEGVIDRNIIMDTSVPRAKTINVALAGNPNSGKTTLYNQLSGARERVGNYSGVTVDIKKTTFTAYGYTFHFFDLPGTYSLTAYTAEEIYVRKFIYEETPDVVINVLDSTNLERNLFLTTQLIDMDLRVVVALNMYDELTKQNQQLNFDKLGRLMGMPFVPTVSSRGEGLDELLQKVIRVYEGTEPTTRHIHINYGQELESSIKAIRDIIRENKPITDKMSSRFLAIKLLEKDQQVLELMSAYPNFMEIAAVTHKEIKRIETLLNEDSETIVTDAKYGFISGALKETMHTPKPVITSLSDKIDRVLTHPKLALPIFGLILFLVFYTTFTLGAYPMDWIDLGVGLISDGLRSIMPDGMLKDLLIDGIISGTGSVLVFLPNILILFFFISLLEGTGYMARASFIMDKVMHKFGLHGRSFIPMIMGFGCNVPAILATRTLRNRGDRLLTMLIVPFMSCSARLPVYILIISAFFTKFQALILIGIYAFGIILAFITAQVFNKLMFKNKETPFVMELPTYRMPTLRNILFNMWEKTKHYLKKIGTVILVGVVIIWALEYFPRTTEKTAGFEATIETLQAQADTDEAAAALLQQTEMEMEADRLMNSYIGRLGKVMQPIMSPMGFDWKMSIALLAGLPAKEIIISTMGVLYQSNVDESTVNLQEKLISEVHDRGKLKGEKVFNTASALAFLVFILVYFPCIGTVAAINNESGTWKWGAFSVAYTTSLAWILALITYQIAILII
jgi:ferrous iron transport protein B